MVLGNFPFPVRVTVCVTWTESGNVVAMLTAGFAGAVLL